MLQPTLNSEMTLTLIPCNHCKGTGLSPSRDPGILLPERCPQCEGPGCILEIIFVPAIYLDKHGWTVRGALARIETKGDRPFDKLIY